MPSNRKSYSILFKRFVIKHYANSIIKSKRKTGTHFRVGRTQLIQWIYQREQIMNQTNVLSRRNIQNPYQKTKNCLYVDCEEKLYEWFLKQRELNYVISTLSLQTKMFELVKEMHPLDSIIFKASRGWMQNFMKLALRRITTSGREMPKNCAEIIKTFLKDVEERIETTGNLIYAFDVSN